MVNPGLASSIYRKTGFLRAERSSAIHLALALATLALSPRPARAFSTKIPILGAAAKFTEQGKLQWETRSCPPPRFDVFCEVLVGDWNAKTIDDTANNNKISSVVTVEEVMRSCGGAVQGIREPQCGDDESTNDEQKNDSIDKNNSVYLNRANDGFLFFDDGSYTMGPTAIDTKIGSMDDKDSGSLSFLTSLSLPKPGSEGRRQRLVIPATTAECDDSLHANDPKVIQLQPHTTSLRTKKRFGDAADAASLASSSENQRVNDNTMPTIAIETITKITHCRMPTENQPWMLQRAKWETFVPKKPTTTTETKQDELSTTTTAMDNDDTGSKDPSSWVVSEPAENFFRNLGMTDITSKEGVVVQSGLACHQSNTLRILARHYRSNNDKPNENNDNASLCGVFCIEGSVRFEEQLN